MTLEVNSLADQINPGRQVFSLINKNLLRQEGTYFYVYELFDQNMSKFWTWQFECKLK